MPDAEAMKRWRAWWRFANMEQLATFVAITLATILFTSILAHALLQGRDDLPRDMSFLALQGELLSQQVGGWFGRFFWIVGAFALFMVAVGAVDISGRLAADVVHTSYKTGRSESALYAVVVWIIVALGIAIIGSGTSQPLVLLTISGSISAFMMFLYSGLLMRLNRRLLDPPLRPGVVRITALVASMIFFGLISAAILLAFVGALD